MESGGHTHVPSLLLQGVPRGGISRGDSTSSSPEYCLAWREISPARRERVIKHQHIVIHIKPTPGKIINNKNISVFDSM